MTFNIQKVKGQLHCDIIMFCKKCFGQSRLTESLRWCDSNSIHLRVEKVAVMSQCSSQWQTCEEHWNQQTPYLLLSLSAVSAMYSDTYSITQWSDPYVLCFECLG